MSDHVKAIFSTVVIVACLALLGAMVYLKVDGAGVAAAAIVTTIVAWLTRTPDRKDPPPGATLVPLAGAGVLLTCLLACTTPVSKLPEPTIEQKRAAAGVKYGDQLIACTVNYSTPATIDACADEVRARAKRLDGGAQ